MNIFERAYHNNSAVRQGMKGKSHWFNRDTKDYGKIVDRLQKQNERVYADAGNDSRNLEHNNDSNTSKPSSVLDNKE